MVIHGVTAVILASVIGMTPIQAVTTQSHNNFFTSVVTPEYINEVSRQEQVYENIGTYRISIFCKFCNEPQGTGSKSGKPLRAGHVATQDLPIGSEIAIEGEEYEVTDTCGVQNTIDIYVENDSGYCQCNSLDYKDVYLKQKE